MAGVATAAHLRAALVGLDLLLSGAARTIDEDPEVTRCDQDQCEDAIAGGPLEERPDAEGPNSSLRARNMN
jgi:hypothetical protein